MTEQGQTTSTLEEEIASMRWDFSKGATFLQTDSQQEDQVQWYLAREGDVHPEPAIWVQLHPSAQDLLDTLAHFAEKSWMTDRLKGQMLEAMMPAIRAVLHR